MQAKAAKEQALRSSANGKAKPSESSEEESSAAKVESDDEAAILNRWISASSKDKPKVSKDAHSASDSAAAPRSSSSQHNLAASSQSSLTGDWPETLVSLTATIFPDSWEV